MRDLLSFFIIGLSLITSVFTYNCTQQYQCESVSANYNYVQCVSGVCQCIGNGFSGNATTSNPCQCSYGNNNVFWGGDPSQPYCLDCVSPFTIYYEPDTGIPYCSDPATCSDDLFTKYQIYEGILRKLFQTNFQIENTLNILNGVDPINEIAPQAQIGVVEIGFFLNRTGIIQYLYAVGLAFQIQSTDFYVIYVDPIHNASTFRLDIKSITPLGQPQNVTITGFVSFYPNNTVATMDITIPQIGRIVSLTSEVIDGMIQLICETVMAYCTGGYQQYASYAVCVAYHEQLNVGSPYEARSNSTYCHFIHALMIPYGWIHCFHDGYEGGLVVSVNGGPIISDPACIDVGPEEYYDYNFFYPPGEVEVNG